MHKGNDMLGVWYEMSKNLYKTDLKLLRAIWLVTWNARNRLIFKEKKVNPSILVVKAQAIMEDFQRVKHVEKTQSEK